MTTYEIINAVVQLVILRLVWTIKYPSPTMMDRRDMFPRVKERNP